MTAHPTTATTPTTAPGRRRRGRLLRILPPVTLLSVLTITASSEYELARTVLNLDPRIAWALPVAIDSYVLAALRSGRDVGAALTVMAGALATAMGAHLLDAQSAELPPEVLAPTATVIMVILVVVAWRVHVLIEEPQPADGHGADLGAAAVAASTPSVRGEYTRPEAEHTPETAGYTSPGGEYTGPGSGVAEYGPALPGAYSDARAVYSAEGAASGVVNGRVVGVRALPRPTPPAVTHLDHAQPPHAENDEGADEASREGGQVPPPDPGPPSDEEILAEIAGDPPGVRALMRAYGIGQARAKRLREQALTSTDTPNRTRPEHHDQQTTTDQNSDQDNETEGMTQTSPEESTSTSTDRNAKNSDQETKIESARIQSEESHTGITDRVGQPRSTTHAFPDAPEMARDASGEGILFPEWEAELAAETALDGVEEPGDPAGGQGHGFTPSGGSEGPSAGAGASGRAVAGEAARVAGGDR